jgi:nitroreductase
MFAGAIAAAAPQGTRASAALAVARLHLPAPRQTGGKPLLEALMLRRSTREFSERPLPLQVISEICWAAYGINRPSADRTAPYWRHVMVLDVFLAQADGVWVYEPASHSLVRHLEDDIRVLTGRQEFVGHAPLNLIYVAHGERMVDISAEDRRLYASVDAAFLGQNVYLYCASEGLATVFRGAVDYVNLDWRLNLPDQSFVTFAQTVGYPAA